MRGKWVLIAVAVVLAAMAAGALSSRLHREQPRPAPAPQQNAAQPASGDVSLPGKIQAAHTTPVSAQIDGQIEAFLADVGDEVSEGQILARIANKNIENTRELAVASVENTRSKVSKAESAIIAARLEASRARADASRARSEYERTEKVYRRQEMLHGQGATPRLVYEKSQREFQSAETEFRSLDELARQSEDRINGLLQELQAAKKLLDEKQKDLEEAEVGVQATEVHSPVDGVVTSRKGEPGKEIGPDADSRVLFQIATDTTDLEAVLDPEPPLLKRIKPGQSAMVLIADLQEGLPANVKEIRGNQAIVEFKNPFPVVRPGMTAQVRIKVE